MRSGIPDRFRIGTAGWSIPRQHAHHTATEGSHLERYAQRFSCVEINSSFYRSHKPETWARWAASVPPGFRFAVKTPKSITHEAQLDCRREDIQRFLDETSALGEKRGPILVQLPPKLEFTLRRAKFFFTALRKLYGGPLVLEPRHESWFDSSVDQVLRDHRIARVAADPPKPKSTPAAAEPGGWAGLIYYRLHGSPCIYYSQYSDEFLNQLAARIESSRSETWCIFDNTASGAAFEDAIKLKRLVV